MTALDNIIGEPPLALTPLVTIKERLGLDSGSTQHDAELSALALALTGAFERATGRVLSKRTDVSMILSGCDYAAYDLIFVDETTPAIALTSVDIDTTATDPVDVVFDSTTLIAPSDYTLVNFSNATGWAPAGVRLRMSVHPDGVGVDNIRIVLDCGFTPDDGSPGFTAPVGEFGVPGAIVEALLEQVELVWRRRGEIHLASKSISTPGGGGTIAYWSTKLARSVKETLAPYATPTAALNLGEGFAASSAGQA